MKKNIFKFLVMCNLWTWTVMGCDHQRLDLLCDTYNDIIWSKPIKLPTTEDVQKELSSLITEEVRNKKSKTNEEFQTFCEQLKKSLNNQRFGYFIDIFKTIYLDANNRNKFAINMLIEGLEEKFQEQVTILNRKHKTSSNQNTLEDVTFEDLVKKYTY